MSDGLDDAAIAERLRAVPHWRIEGGSLVRTFSCGDFDGSLAFVNRVADAARAADHHPGITIDWGTVRLTLVSHDIGGIGKRDFALAETIDHFAG